MSVIRDGKTCEYVVESERPDGSLIIRPQTALEQMLARQGTREMTSEEFEEILGPHLLPPDGEG